MALYLQLFAAFVQYGNGAITQSAWQRSGGSFFGSCGLLCLCQSPGPGRKRLSARASNILAWTLDSWNHGNVYRIETQGTVLLLHCAVLLCRRGFLMGKENLLKRPLCDELIEICGLSWSLLSSFVLPIQLFLPALAEPFDSHVPADLLLDSAADSVSLIVPRMTCIDKARNFMLHLLPRLNNHAVLCQNYEGRKEREKERRTCEAERD